MLIFGWGSKTKEFAPNPGTRLLVAYSYFHLMFLFTAAWGAKYLVATWTEQGWAWAQTTKEHATAINGGVTPDINPWWKFSLMGFAGLGVLLVILTSLLPSAR